jgi:serine/threonine protein kinase
VVQCRYFFLITRNIKTGVLYALKKIFKSVIDEYRMEDQLLTELQILKQIDHPNIVRAYESFTDDFHIFILMEYIHGPLLVQKLKCSESECKVIIRQVLEALKYLHENKITHRDIKP